VGEPLVFACAQPNLAANVRDYVTSRRRRGSQWQDQYVLIAYFWSTLDPRVRRDPLPPEPLVLQADDGELSSSCAGTRHTRRVSACRCIAPPGPP